MIVFLIIGRLLVFALGAGLVFIGLRSAIKTFVLPRAAPDGLTRATFTNLRRLFNVAAVRVPDYKTRDRLMAFYGPVGLLTLMPILLLVIDTGFTLMFWAIHEQPIFDAFSLSGSSLMTLGFMPPGSLPERILAVAEAAIGMIMVALLIAYLPTIYSVFSARETLVSTLEVLAGSPPWGITMIERHFLLDRVSNLSVIWSEWERWFTQLEETHTSLSAVVFFRSQRPNRSWITAAGAVLDAASFTRAAVNITPDPRADLMIRAGYLALRYIAQLYGFVPRQDPQFPRDPISVSRQEFDDACARLASGGVPIQPDRDRAWHDFAGWRVNYDAALLGLCALVMAPKAPWSSDRAEGRWSLTPRFKTPNIALDEDTQYRQRKEAELPNINSLIAGREKAPGRGIDPRLVRRSQTANTQLNPSAPGQGDDARADGGGGAQSGDEGGANAKLKRKGPYLTRRSSIPSQRRPLRKRRADD